MSTLADSYVSRVLFATPTPARGLDAAARQTPQAPARENRIQEAPLPQVPGSENQIVGTPLPPAAQSPIVSGPVSQSSP